MHKFWLVLAWAVSLIAAFWLGARIDSDRALEDETLEKWLAMDEKGKRHGGR